MGGFNEKWFWRRQNAICGKRKTTQFRSQFVHQSHRIYTNLHNLTLLEFLCQCCWERQVEPNKLPSRRCWALSFQQTQGQAGCGSGQPGLVVGDPAYGRGVESRWSLRSFSTQAILWFYDSWCPSKLKNHETSPSLPMEDQNWEMVLYVKLSPVNTYENT